MQLNAQFSTPETDADAESVHSFDSPWTVRYEVKPLVDRDVTSYVVVDKKNRELLVANFKSRQEADLECAILTLAHLKALRSKKSGQLKR